MVSILDQIYVASIMTVYLGTTFSGSSKVKVMDPDMDAAYDNSSPAECVYARRCLHAFGHGTIFWGGYIVNCQNFRGFRYSSLVGSPSKLQQATAGFFRYLGYCELIVLVLDGLVVGHGKSYDTRSITTHPLCI